ncbi:MAG: PHP domain-containing protein [Legionella sp.]|nr:PHP domain-containing protein [Legionella sp.]
MIDLHCHSIFSDGTLTPEELIERAEQQQIRYLSLTDHDTIAGYPRLLARAAHSTVTIIPGIELSTRWKKYDIHILGYQIKSTKELDQLIQRQVDSRIERAKKIGEALATLGLEDAYQKACSLAGHERAARPHFAQVLVNENMARDLQTAFKHYLVKGRKGYIPTPWLSVAEAVEGIAANGGQAVIAHPLKYGLTRSKLHELINEFKEAGGIGLEVISGGINLNDIQEMAGICNRFGLYASTGSDFHGDTASYTQLGRQKTLPEQCLPIWQNWNLS